MFSDNIRKNEAALEQLTDDVLKGSYGALQFFNEFSLYALREPSPRELAKFVVRTLCFERIRESIDNKYERYFFLSVIGLLVCGNIFQYKYNCSSNN